MILKLVLRSIRAKCFLKPHRTFHKTCQRLTQNEIQIKNSKIQNYLKSLHNEYYQLCDNPNKTKENSSRLERLDTIVKMLNNYDKIAASIVQSADVEQEKDAEFRKLITEENMALEKQLETIENEIIEKLLHLTSTENYEAVYFGLTAGAGGKEAMLFSMDLYKMYMNYVAYKQWDYEILEEDLSDLGGLRHANVWIRSDDAYDNLRFEAGVHRVQRIPLTEKAGRPHTSTVSITVIPEIPNLKIDIDEKSLKIETKRASGAGGQHVNTTNSAVRIVHLPSGIVAESQTERSQIKNKEIALRKIRWQLIQSQMRTSAEYKKVIRKSQQGNIDRNEKIRTYNFMQDRITDHRVSNGTFHNIKKILEGTTELDMFIKHVSFENQKLQLLEQIKNSEN